MVQNNIESIIYINFSPYENTGKILDYLVKRFYYVFLFSFEHYRLDDNRTSNFLQIYKNGNLEKEIKIYKPKVYPTLIFLLLPLRSTLILIQIFYYVLYIKKYFGKPTYYFTVNAFTAWVGNRLRDFQLLDKTIFWVWDYYPPVHKDLLVRTMRKLYWIFDKSATAADKLVFLNQKLIDFRKNIHTLPNDIKYSIVPIGTTPQRHSYRSPPTKRKIVIGFIGVLKKSQGLEMIFDAQHLLTHNFPNVTVEIIGDGPDKQYFLKRALGSSITCNFYGLLSENNHREETKIYTILQKCHIGLATYIPEKSNVSYFGDPSKIKKYLSMGLPVITTNVFYFSKELESSGGGILVNYYKKEELLQAVLYILAHYKTFQKNAYKLANKYNYQTAYKKIFDF